MQVEELQGEIARLEEENAAKRAKMSEESARARGRGDGGAAGEDEPMEELTYDDSSVKRYECEAVRLCVKQADLSRGVKR